MNKIFRIIAIVLSTVLILFATVSFLLKFYRVSTANEEKEFSSLAVVADVEIVYNKIGIPHIYADSKEDLFFGIGFSQAENRLWQMDFYRRIAEGKLSEVLGDNYILTDKFMRSIGIPSITSEIYQKMPNSTKMALQKFSDGINYFIEQNNQNFPLEFSILGYKPEKWRPENCIEIQRLLALQMTPSVLTDIIFSQITNFRGIEFTKLLLPNFQGKKQFNPINPTFSDQDFIDTLRESDTLQNIYFKNTKEVFEKIGINDFNGGSNSWVIRKKTDSTYRATLANDLHLPMTTPSILFQIQAFSDDNFHVTGFTIPGIPFVVSGRNDNIAWGFTNMLADQFDYFEERINKNGNKFLNQDSVFTPIKFIIDTIHVKDKNYYRYYQRFTDRSCIISDFHIYNSEYLFLQKKRKTNQKNISYSFNWTGKIPTDELTALFKINSAENWNEFLQATSHWCTPGVVFSYADADGNIANRPSALIPEREKEINPWLVNKYRKVHFEWKTETLNKLRYSFNPSSNYLASANNSFFDSSYSYISYYFDNDSRIKRIYEFLSKLRDFELRDMKNMQLDVYSYYSKSIMNIVLPILNHSKSIMSNKELEILKDLNKWDFRMTGNDICPTVFNAFLLNLIYNTFHDELGDEFFLDYTYYSTIPYNRILELLNSRSGLFFDNNKTETNENFAFTVFKSYQDALKYLKDFSKNPTLEKWKWSDFHRLKINHIFSNNKHLQDIFANYSVGLSGSWSTINYGNWEFRKPFNIRTGVATRLIINMHDSVVNSIIPGGISGDPTNLNYNNQIRIWSNGGYFKIIHSKNRIVSNNKRIFHSIK